MARPRKLPPGIWQRGDTYYARLRVGGRLIRKRLSSDFTTAKALLNEIRAKAERGDFGLSDNDYSWAELKREFLRWAKQSVRNPDDYERDLAAFEAYAPIGSVREISQDRMMGYRAKLLADELSPRTVNRKVGTVNNALNKGVEWKRIASNPIKGLKPLKHDAHSKERRSLTPDEVERLFAASPPRMRQIWRTFLCTGLRHNELASLRFADVDFRRRIITVRAVTAKSRKAREIPLDDETLADIQALAAMAKERHAVAGPTAAMTAKQAANFSREHVFVTKANTPWRNNLLKRFYACAQRAGIEGAERKGDVDLHSLRVTFTTLSLDGGAAPKAVQKILGHSTLDLTMRVYARATDQGMRAAVSALPFAKASPPDHVIPVQKAHTARTSDSESLKRIPR